MLQKLFFKFREIMGTLQIDDLFRVKSNFLLVDDRSENGVRFDSCYRLLCPRETRYQSVIL